MAVRISGTRTPEYAAFLANFSTLTEGITQSLTEFATKVFQKALISSNNLSEAKNWHNSEYGRASDLMLILLRRVEFNTEDFYVILDILRSIPVLDNLVRILTHPGNKIRRQVQAPVRASAPTAGNNIAVNESPKLVQENPKLMNVDPKLVLETPKLVNVDPKLVLETPKLPKLVRENMNMDPKLVRENPKLVNVVDPKPKLVRDNPKRNERPTNAEAFRALISVSEKWKVIGTLLELMPGKLDSIESQYHNDTERMMGVVQVWLTTLSANWGSLIDAVELVDSQKAFEIERDFLSS